MAGDGVVVIKRIKKVSGGGHHGGAWKVAYADFVTAMMAFFLLMWLINTTSPEQKRGIADYFAAHNISQSQSGAGGVMAGTVFATEGARVGGGVSQINEQLPPQPRREDNDAQGGADDNDGSENNGQGGTAFAQGQSDETMERQRPSFDDGQFAQAAMSLRQAMQRMPEIAELSQQLLMEQTTEGLNIQLVDQEGRAMFERGTANLLPAARRVLQQVAEIVDRLPNRIAITGHTDAAPFQGPDGTTNWELSAARANAARTVLAMEGVESDRIFHVSGKAGTDPLLPDNPYSSSNRRISILLMREAPVVPPGYKL